MKLLDLYKSILSLAGLRADGEGMISAVVDDTSMPFTVKGKRLVLPTKAQLQGSDWENRIVFHPLSENIVRPGESEVLQRYRGALTIRLNLVIARLLEELMVLATSTKLHKKLNPDQAELLTVLRDADEKTLTNLQSIIKNAQNTAKTKGIIHLFLKKGGIVNDVKYPRACIVSFPLYDDIINNEKTIYGVSVRVKDVTIYKNLMEFMFPQISQPEAYNRGSNDDVAPFLDALMKTMAGLAGAINAIVEGYSEFLTDSEGYMYESDWVETFENLTTMLPEIRMIPMQAGNEGGIKEVPDGQLQNVVAPTYIAPQPQQYQQPYQPQQAAPTQPEIVVTEGGLDFNSVLATNPMLQRAAMPQMQPVHPMNQQPSWAQPQYQQPYQQPQQFQQPMQYGGYGNQPMMNPMQSMFQQPVQQQQMPMGVPLAGGGFI